MESNYPATKSKVAAALFAAFLGGVGVHRFYLGYKKAGVLQLIFDGIFGIIGSIFIACAPYTYYYTYYGHRYSAVDYNTGLLVFGIIFLVVSFGFGIWVLVDFIRILTGSLRPADGSLYIQQEAKLKQQALNQGVASTAQSNGYYNTGYAAPTQPKYVNPVNSYQAASPQTQAVQDENVLALQRLNALKERGLITEEEYEEKRKEIISRI